MSGKRMTERVAPRMLDYIRFVNRIFDGPLEDRLVYMMATLLAGRCIPPAVLLRKNPLPTPVCWGIRILAVQSVGHQNTAPTFGQVFLVDRLDISQMILKGSQTSEKLRYLRRFEVLTSLPLFSTINYTTPLSFVKTHRRSLIADPSWKLEIFLVDFFETVDCFKKQVFGRFN